MLRCWKREYVYELMRLGLEATPYRTLEHIAGVHHVAMTAGRALHRAGIPVDLALVSGSAAGHDIGKFGCRPGERVPYLHYYYTDLWFRRRRLTDIGHVAANHSVWDLEPDYLSVESLLLIYADFRVKQSVGPDGREITRISSLSEAFDVILSKLDAVDDAKRQRYMRVYARLRDFEQFMADKGVDVTLQGHDTPPRPQKQTALMTDEEALHALTMQCVGHNMELMSRLTGQRSFAQLLELARGETNWRRLRAYLGVFESYSLYLHIPQKVQTLAFLYELLMHREGDIRRQAAALLGELICDPVTYHGRFVPEYFESEKTNLLEAIRSLINDKRDWADSRLLRALCDGEAYAVPRLGDEETVDKLQALKVYTQYRDLISTAPLEIIYSGSADLERVKQALAAAFATLPREEVRVISTAAPHVCRESVQYVEDVLDTFLQAITTRKVKNLPQYMKSLLWTSLATYKLNIISGITAPYKEVKNVYGLH